MHKYFSGLTPQPPMPWLLEPWKRFTLSCERNQLPHALLLSSIGGVGEVDLAYAMAHYLLCVSPQNGQACGTCKACHLLQAQSHPDLMSISPEEKSSVIKIDAIREVSSFVANTAQQGGRKLVVVYPADVMNGNAANALLKNLEEPTGDTVFILVTQKPAMLMPTIRSRCTHWPLKGPDTAEALAWLERNKIKDASHKLSVAGGCPLEVIQWDSSGLYEQAQKAESVMAEYINGQADMAKTAKTLASYDPLWLLNQWQRWLQDAIKSDAVGKDALGKKDAILFKGGGMRLFQLSDVIATRKAQLMRGANPNVQLMIEELLLGLSPS